MRAGFGIQSDKIGSLKRKKASGIESEAFFIFWYTQDQSIFNTLSILDLRSIIALL